MYDVSVCGNTNEVWQQQGSRQNLFFRFCSLPAAQHLPSFGGKTPWGLLCWLALFADWESLHRPNWFPLLLGASLDR